MRPRGYSLLGLFFFLIFILVLPQFALAAPPASAPNLTSPADGTTITTHTPSFSWGSVAGATSYEIQISDSTEFTILLRGGNTGLNRFYNVSGANPLPDGLYYWRVRANTIAGVGPWSEVRRFSINTLAPSLISYPESAVVTTHTPSFSWDSVPAATSYEIQISDSTEFTIVLRGGNTGLNRFYNVSGANPLPDGLYYWRVMANTIAGVGPWSEVRSFSIYTLAPEPTTPAEGAILATRTPSFAWGSIATATSYEIQISDTSAFTTIWRSSNTGLNRFYTVSGATPLPDGAYFWRIRANTVSGNGPWSKYRRFGVYRDVNTFSAPALVAPINPDQIISGAPTFSWTGIIGANGYHLEIDNNLDFSSLERDIYVGELYHSPGTALSDGLYYWRVQATNGAVRGAWSETRVVILRPALIGSPNQIAPLDGSAVDDSTPVLKWGAVTGAQGYHILIDNNQDYSSPERNISVSSFDLQHVLGTALPDDLYYWKVQATTSTGGQWSETRTFAIITPLSGVPQLISPSNASTVNSNTPVFSWDALPNVSSYRIQIDNQGEFLTPERDTVVTVPTYTPATGLNNGLYYWRVQAGTIWSEVWLVQIQADVISPDGAAPPLNYLVTGTPTLTWSAVAEAITYQLEIARDSGFEQLVYTFEGSDLQTTVNPALSVGTYYWRVRAVTPGGNGNWSVVDSFVIGA